MKPFRHGHDHGARPAMSIAKRGPISAYGRALFPGPSAEGESGRRRRLRIAYLCDRDPNDPNLYSGGNRRIRDALQAHAGEVTVLPQDWGALDWLRRGVEALPDALSIRLRWRLHFALAPLIARRVNRELERRPPDIVFGAYALHALAGIRPPPGTLTVFTSDATPTTYRQSEIGESFGSFLSASRLLDPALTRAEARALARADLLLWPTSWLDRAARAAYALPEGGTRVIPWGANVPRPATAAEPGAIGPD
ncbi:glycosyltransferase, partial [Aquicoccus sp. SCR17]|nr:glycosyltransferase [Carideicomes alvinocaridis]